MDDGNVLPSLIKYIGTCGSNCQLPSLIQRTEAVHKLCNSDIYNIKTIKTYIINTE